jgi:hypothetical protein
MCETPDFSLNIITVFQKRTVFYMPEQAAELPSSLGSMISFLLLGDLHDFQISRPRFGLLRSNGFGRRSASCSSCW